MDDESWVRRLELMVELELLCEELAAAREANDGSTVALARLELLEEREERLYLAAHEELARPGRSALGC